MYLQRKFKKVELLPKQQAYYKFMFAKFMRKIDINKQFIPSLVVSLR